MADADALREAGVPSRLPANPDTAVTPPGSAPLTPAPAAAPPAEEKVMTLVDHLTELRNRIFISVATVVVGSAIGFYFSEQIIALLKSPLPLDPTTGQARALNFLAPGEAFFVYVKIAFAVGIIIGMPVIVYQVWRFVSPGLTPQERKIARPWVPIAAIFFLVGIAVAWVVLPFALQFLVGFENKDFHYLPTADAYFGFITTLFLAFGLTMEFPIALVLLSKVGIITSQRLRSSRRVVILGIAVFSAVVTPGGDLVSPTVLGGVMYLLFELSIRLVKWGGH
jgi:sec-independent protein translocase protein TatC